MPRSTTPATTVTVAEAGPMLVRPEEAVATFVLTPTVEVCATV
jgi:hypothetical protein